MQGQHVSAPRLGMKPINVLGDHPRNSAVLLKLNQRIVGAVRFGLLHAPPPHIGTRPVALAGSVIIPEFLVGHGAVLTQGTGGATVIRDTGFGTNPRPGERKHPACTKHTSHPFEGNLRLVRLGGLGNNTLDRTDRGTVHGGNLVIIESGRVSPFIHCVPVCRRSRMYCTYCRMRPAMTVHAAGIRTGNDRVAPGAARHLAAHEKNFWG